MEFHLVDPLDKWEPTPASDAVSLVVVGKTGTGKSATANIILGREAFISKLRPSGVTRTSELKSATVIDGRNVNVIDTPGLFGISTGNEFIGREIAKCIDLAKDGVHAVLVVFSIRSRFAKEDMAAINSMKTLFGDRIVDYMIVVFTGGDTLEECGDTLRDYINWCPEQLKDIIQMCKDRVVLFDNNTKDMIKREGQVKDLLSLVDSVIASNGGKPFTGQIFAEVKKEALLLQQMEREIDTDKGYSEKDDQLKRITEMVEQKLNPTIEKLKEQLAVEQAARLEAAKVAEAARLRSEEEVQKLKQEQKMARKEFRNHVAGRCAFL